MEHLSKQAVGQLNDQKGKEAQAATQPAAAARGTKVVAIGRSTSAADAARAGGDAAGGRVVGGIDSAHAEKEEAEEGDGPPISWVQDEVLCIILSQLDANTLMIVVPQVCKFWRSMCQELSGVHLDFGWWGGEDGSS